MGRFFMVAKALSRQEFVCGSLFGIALTTGCVIGLSQLGAFPKESESLLLSADYHLSRTEMRLREEIRYLEQELALSRRAHSSIASYRG
jgi:hypothetical protein